MSDYAQIVLGLLIAAAACMTVGLHQLPSFAGWFNIFVGSGSLVCALLWRGNDR